MSRNTLQTATTVNKNQHKYGLAQYKMLLVLAFLFFLGEKAMAQNKEISSELAAAYQWKGGDTVTLGETTLLRFQKELPKTHDHEHNEKEACQSMYVQYVPPKTIDSLLQLSSPFSNGNRNFSQPTIQQYLQDKFAAEQANKRDNRERKRQENTADSCYTMTLHYIAANSEDTKILQDALNSEYDSIQLSFDRIFNKDHTGQAFRFVVSPTAINANRPGGKFNTFVAANEGGLIALAELGLDPDKNAASAYAREVQKGTIGAGAAFQGGLIIREEGIYNGHRLTSAFNESWVTDPTLNYEYITDKHEAGHTLKMTHVTTPGNFANGTPSEMGLNVILPDGTNPNGETMGEDITSTYGDHSGGNCEEIVCDTTEITLDPSDAEICEGDNHTFHSDATNVTGYQWQFDGQDIPEANSYMYTITNTDEADQGAYSVIVSGTCQNDTSDAAILTVLGLDDPSCGGTTGNCPEEVNLGNVQQDSSIHASTISANGIVVSGAKVTFQGEKSVTLKSGFHAEAGTSFSANIGACPVDTTSREATERVGQNSASISDLNLTVQPNPSNGEFALRFPQNFVPKNICLFGVDGSQYSFPQTGNYQAGETYPFSTEGLAPGMYFLVVTNKDGEKDTIKLIITQ